MLSILKEQLKALRKELGLTQKEISLVLRMPRGTYVHYELGKRAPDIDILMRIADLHRVSLDFLTGYTKRRPTQAEWMADHPDQVTDQKIPSTYRLSNQAKPDKASLKIADDQMPEKIEKSRKTGKTNKTGNDGKAESDGKAETDGQPESNGKAETDGQPESDGKTDT